MKKHHIIPKNYIIPGYNGIMDLNLTNIDKKFHQELAELHFKQIENYKKEQLELPKHLRYEKSVKHTLEQIKHYQNMHVKKEAELQENINRNYELRLKYWKLNNM